MTECGGWQNEDAEIEVLVRAAGEYVRASDDLRPRVLEAARLQRRERLARGWIRAAAALVVVAAFVTAAGREEFDAHRPRPMAMALSAGFDRFLMPTAGASPRCGDGDWRMFEAFSELRRQQAQVLRAAVY